MWKWIKKKTLKLKEDKKLIYQELSWEWKQKVEEKEILVKWGTQHMWIDEEHNLVVKQEL